MNQQNMLPWVEKYRPTNLDDIICQNNIITTLKEFLHKKSLPHMIFYGPPGTGKTSTIMACVNQLFDVNQFEVISLNASDERGVEIVRQRIKHFVESDIMFSKESSNFKIVILDEADSMTEDAQFSLRQLIMNYSEKVRFCIICNYIHKIIPALQSRCCKFRYIPIPYDYINKYLTDICQLENIDYDNEGLKNIIDIGKGDLRKVINILQTVYLIDGNITPSNVLRITNTPDNNIIPKILLQCSTKKNINDTLNYVNNIIISNGYSVISILNKLLDYIISIYIPEKYMIDIIDKLSNLERKLALKYYNNNTLFIYIISLIYQLLIDLF
jgi:replication factor C subunit 3/5